jgi:hypothetical protein
MVELNTLFLVGLIGFGVGVLTVGGFVLLVVIYNNIKKVTDKMKQDDDEEDSTFAIPLSMLGGLGGGRNISTADIQRAAAAMAAQGGAPSSDTKKASEGDGMYL